VVYNQNPSTSLLNVCISTDNANTERVQAQDTGTINSRTMKRLAITRSHTTTTHTTPKTWSRRGIDHICLLGQAWPTLPLMRYRVGMERR
jgi:hypothetical protein